MIIIDIMRHYQKAMKDSGLKEARVVMLQQAGFGRATEAENVVLDNMDALKPFAGAELDNAESVRVGLIQGAVRIGILDRNLELKITGEKADTFATLYDKERERSADARSVAVHIFLRLYGPDITRQNYLNLRSQREIGDEEAEKAGKARRMNVSGAVGALVGMGDVDVKNSILRDMAGISAVDNVMEDDRRKVGELNEEKSRLEGEISAVNQNKVNFKRQLGLLSDDVSIVKRGLKSVYWKTNVDKVVEKSNSFLVELCHLKDFLLNARYPESSRQVRLVVDLIMAFDEVLRDPGLDENKWSQFFKGHEMRQLSDLMDTVGYSKEREFNQAKNELSSIASGHLEDVRYLNVDEYQDGIEEDSKHIADIFYSSLESLGGGVIFESLSPELKKRVNDFSTYYVSLAESLNDDNQDDPHYTKLVAYFAHTYSPLINDVQAHLRGMMSDVAQKEDRVRAIQAELDNLKPYEGNPLVDALKAAKAALVEVAQKDRDEAKGVLDKVKSELEAQRALRVLYEERGESDKSTLKKSLRLIASHGSRSVDIPDIETMTQRLTQENVENGDVVKFLSEREDLVKALNQSFTAAGAENPDNDSAQFIAYLARHLFGLETEVVNEKIIAEKIDPLIDPKTRPSGVTPDLLDFLLHCKKCLMYEIIGDVRPKRFSEKMSTMTASKRILGEANGEDVDRLKLVEGLSKALESLSTADDIVIHKDEALHGRVALIKDKWKEVGKVDAEAAQQFLDKNMADIIAVFGSLSEALQKGYDNVINDNAAIDALKASLSTAEIALEAGEKRLKNVSAQPLEVIMLQQAGYPVEFDDDGNVRIWGYELGDLQDDDTRKGILEELRKMRDGLTVQRGNNFVTITGPGGQLKGLIAELKKDRKLGMPEIEAQINQDSLRGCAVSIGAYIKTEMAKLSKFKSEDADISKKLGVLEGMQENLKKTEEEAKKLYDELGKLFGNFDLAEQIGLTAHLPNGYLALKTTYNSLVAGNFTLGDVENLHSLYQQMIPYLEDKGATAKLVKGVNITRMQMETVGKADSVHEGIRGAMVRLIYPDLSPVEQMKLATDSVKVDRALNSLDDGNEWAEALTAKKLDALQVKAFEKFYERMEIQRGGAFVAFKKVVANPKMIERPESLRTLMKNPAIGYEVWAALYVAFQEVGGGAMPLQCAIIAEEMERKILEEKGSRPSKPKLSEHQRVKKAKALVKELIAEQEMGGVVTFFTNFDSETGDRRKKKARRLEIKQRLAVLKTEDPGYNKRQFIDEITNIKASNDDEEIKFDPPVDFFAHRRAKLEAFGVERVEEHAWATGEALVRETPKAAIRWGLGLPLGIVNKVFGTNLALPGFISDFVASNVKESYGKGLERAKKHHSHEVEKANLESELADLDEELKKDEERVQIAKSGINIKDFFMADLDDLPDAAAA